MSESHPQTGADAAMRSLENNGVEHIFGIPGGAILPGYDAVDRSQIDLVQVIDERGAGFMAQGYSRASRKPGVVLTTSGPGGTNMVTPAYDSKMDSTPLVVLTGQVATDVMGTDAFQEAPMRKIFRPVVKHSEIVRHPRDMARIINKLMRISMEGRPGPVHGDLPKDVLGMEYENRVMTPRVRKQEDGNVDNEALAKVADLIIKNPDAAILAGAGVMHGDAVKELLALAKQQKIPVIETLLGKGVMSEEDALNFGMSGMHGNRPANEVMKEARLLIALGSRLDDRIVGNKTAFRNMFDKIVHVDIDPNEIGRNIEPDVAIVGNVKFVLNALQAELTARSNKIHPDRVKWLEHVIEYKRLYPLEYRNKNGLSMQAVIDKLCKLTDGDAIVTTDVGQHQMWAAQYWKSKKPNSWITSGGAGSMGFGFPAAIGAQIARPNERVIAIVGDGGYQMTMQEMATACEYGLPVKVVVLDNGHLGMVRQWQKRYYGNVKSGSIMKRNPNFANIAKEYGAAGFSVDSPGELTQTLKAFLAVDDRPAVLHAKVNPEDDVYPWIGSGESHEDMRLDPDFAS